MAANRWVMEKGVLGREDGGLFSAAAAMKAGAALAEIFGKGNICTGMGDSPAAGGILRAAESGILQQGGNVWAAGSCFESQFGYCVGRSGADCGLFVDFSGEIRLYGRGGLPLCEREQQDFLEAAKKPEPRAVYWGDWGRLVSMENLREFYCVELIRAAETTLCGISADIKCANPRLCGMLRETFVRLGGKLRDGGLTVQVSADGRDVTVYRTMQDIIHTDRVLCLVCLDLFRRGEDVALPASAPRMLDRAAAEAGRQVFRYEDGFPACTGMEARGLAVRQPFLRDGAMLALRLLSILKRSGGSLAELESQLPGFAVVSRTVAGNVPAGMVLHFSKGELLLRPEGGKNGVFLSAECRDAETAAELCRFGEESLANGELPEQDAT